MDPDQPHKRRFNPLYNPSASRIYEPENVTYERPESNGTLSCPRTHVRRRRQVQHHSGTCPTHLAPPTSAGSKCVNRLLKKERRGSKFVPNRTGSNYDEYLMAMKRVHHRVSIRSSLPAEMKSPRERHRSRFNLSSGRSKTSIGSIQTSSRIAIIASLVPDEIIDSCDHAVRIYEASLMFVDVSGFSELCENYTLARGGPSRLTQILNCYIGAMVQEILTHNGDVLKFAGDAFIAMWKKTPRHTMQDVVHTAIDCGLIIQKNYGQLMTDVGILLKVKIAISAGVVHFAIIGGGGTSESTCDTYGSSYVICGQPVWDVKMAEYLTAAGDVLTSASAWMYVNEAEYCTQPCGDGRHTKVLGVGATWKRVEQIHSSMGVKESPRSSIDPTATGQVVSGDINYREYSLRPAVITAMRSALWPRLRRFMLAPILRAVDNDEPLDFLTEVRRVVVVFVNIVTKTVTNPVLINIVDTVYSLVSCVTVDSGGLVNKVTIFDKDMMILVIFGLRGLKHADEAQKALQCAHTLKTSIQDKNIISVSIGVTSGIAYCGLVGHVLRREYTVIGPTVNKAARLMAVYTNKVTCDKETFLRSKLDQDYFKLLEPKRLKGVAKPGPIYEFNKMCWPERQFYSRHPLLGRNEEVQKFKAVLQNALDQQHQKFTRYRDHQFGIAFIGPRLIGKTRLLEACLNSNPAYLKVVKINLCEDNKASFGLFRQVVAKTFTGSRGRTYRDIIENRIRHVIDVTSLTPTQIYGLNTIFDCRFPLPERFHYDENVLDNFSVKQLLQEICKIQYETMWILAIEEAQYIDDESWRILLLVLDTKKIFVALCITTDDITQNLLPLSKIGNKCLANNMIVKINLQGIDRWYHAALTCQLLDVQAIPADLEKVIESASGGMPGWIQNFVISLVQRGVLTVASIPRSEAIASGAVTPSPGLLQRVPADPGPKPPQNHKNSFQSIISAVSAQPDTDSVRTIHDEDVVQMAVLAEDYNFGDITVDMAMDVIILQTYDSLTPFEKMLLKCASVLGDVFSRRMLLYLLQNDCIRIVAQAVAKLFEIRVLECEGGDFTRDTSYVMVHPAPAMPTPTPPYCACLGTRPPPNCRDLPMYAFCGYMKFRHSLFRTTTYELLTDSQKHEMHTRVLIFLERYTRRCKSCGQGCFAKLLGSRIDSGLIDESPALKRTREQIRALSAETRVPGESQSSSAFAHDSTTEFRMYNIADVLSSYDFMDTEGVLLSRILESKSPRQSNQLYPKQKRVRSFSSLELENCECLTILQSVYCQIIDHCRGAAEYEKLYEAYLEYVDINIMNLNIPQAVRLLFEVETFVTTHKFYSRNICKDWVMDYQLARICSLRGICMLESGDFGEARKQLLLAMKLYGDPFPLSKPMVRLRSTSASIHLTLVSVVPKFYQQTHSGMVGHFFDDIAATLNRMYRLFIDTKENAYAHLAAKLSLIYALKRGCNFRILCISYGNLISTYQLKQQYSKCIQYEKRALEICRRKHGSLDVTEVQAVCYLYTNIFLFYVEHGKKVESLEFGLSVLHMMTNLIDLSTRQMLVLWMLKLLLSDLRIQDMISIMREFFYMTDYYDLSSETWYYVYAMVILLDTGYSVETYGTCERFYIKKGDAILRSRTPEAAWNFFVSMWLLTIRVGAWEKSILWEDKIKKLMGMTFEKHEFNIMILARLVEGLLITLVNEMDNRNVKKIIILEKSVKAMFKEMSNACMHAPMSRPRYYFLLAYFLYIRGKKVRALNFLKKARDNAKSFAHGPMIIWAEHTLNHWKGTLNPKYIDYWVQHAEDDNLLDYNDFDIEKGKIVPYTLPLPKDLDKN